MALSNKAEIHRIAVANGKHVTGEFFGWYERQCQRLMEFGIQGTGGRKLIGVKSTLRLMRACGKGII
jgi:hypothetical protein